MSLAHPVTVDNQVCALAARVMQGEIDLQQASTTLLDLTEPGSMTLEHTQAIAASVTQAASSPEWRRAMVEAQLGWELARHLAQTVTPQVLHPLLLAYLRGATVSLGQTPQFGLYVQARYIASVLLRDARRLELDELMSWTCTELGQLHLSPLRSQQTHAELGKDAAIHSWYERGHAAHTVGKPYPYPPQAFWLAAQAFRRARRSLTGRDLGNGLVSEVNALEQLAKLQSSAHLATLVPTVREAQTLLNPLQDIANLTYLMGLEQAATSQVNHKLLQLLMVLPLEQYAAVVGDEQTVTAHINLSQLVKPYSRSDALSVLTKVDEAVTRMHDEPLRARYYKSRLTAMAEVGGHDVPNLAAGFNSTLKALQKRGEDENWTLDYLVSGIFGAVVASSSANQEKAALNFLHTLREQGRLENYYAGHADAMRFLRMVLSAGAGVEAVKSEDFDAAIVHYADAIKKALRLGFRDFASTHSQFLVNVVPKGSADATFRTFEILFDLGLELETGLGERGAEPIRQIARVMTRAAFEEHSPMANSNVLHMTWQLAKSRRFAAAMRTGAVTTLASSLETLPLLESINTLRQQVTVQEEVNASGHQAYRSWRLLAFVNDQPPTAGALAAQRLVNLQHHVDQWLERSLAAQSNVLEQDIYALSDIEQDLDERTVLLQLYIAEYHDKRAMAVLLTSQAVTTFHVTPDNDVADVEFEVQGFDESAYSYLEDVMRAREAGWSDKLSSDQQAAVLNAAGGAFLHGSVGTRLKHLRQAGADHLVIVPHGPYHLAPLHLFVREGRMLCDDWVVNVLPTVELLRPRRATVNGRREGAVVLGNSFNAHNPLGLAPLEYAEDEAKRVAKKLGAEPLLGADATEDNLLQGVGSARYVHIATHGVFNLDAPSFQYLALTPGPNSDGRLHAHELLRLDLQGVEIVTLSACETALTRHDRLDNPRGIVAALLLAGVETIVATLWKASDDASRAFFVEFYREIARSTSRRDAFRHAQTQVRRRFPRLKDWGAFYLLGRWD